MGRYLRRLSRHAGESSTDAAAASVAERVAELRRLTIESRELAEPVRYFHDELAMLDVFVELGEIARYPMLEEILRKVSERVLPEFPVRSFMMVHIPEHRFWHGAAHGEGGGLVAFFFFDDLGVGVAHILPVLTAGRNHYLRFTGVVVDAPPPVGPVQRGQA